MHASRRQFLRYASGLSAATAGTAAQRSLPFALTMAGLGSLANQASAASGPFSDYKALVCLFMNGGNDSHNWVVPIDASGYAEYARARSALALPTSNLGAIGTLSSQGSGRQFAMPLNLGPLRNLYLQGRAAVIANVGPLLQPTTKAQYKLGLNLPPKLFSHNDQQSTWQSSSPEGARSGWGGRLADALVSSNAQPVFTSISATGNVVFLSGSGVNQYQVSTAGSVSMSGLNDAWLMGSSTGAAMLKRNLADEGLSPFQREYKRVVQRSIEADVALKAGLANSNVMAIPATPLTLGNGATITLDKDGLAKQLAIVAKIIGAQSALGARRQVFMVSIGGFDTHANELRDQPALMARVAHSVDYFYQAINALGMASKVTLFTASDFGRTLASNGGGSDHGWGSHHFVVGGAVKGGNIYGRFPVTALGTDDEVGSGRLLPGTSVDQLAATLGRWMGVSDADLNLALPGLANFSNRNLGFMA